MNNLQLHYGTPLERLHEQERVARGAKKIKRAAQREREMKVRTCFKFSDVVSHCFSLFVNFSSVFTVCPGNFYCVK